MKIIRILYNQYLDFDGNKLMIGGIENYIRNLSIVFSELNYKVIIYQFSNVKFTKTIDNSLVIGIGSKSTSNIIKAINRDADLDNDIIIFASDYLIKRNKFKKKIAIQHGIAWDITSNADSPLLINMLYSFKSWLKTLRKMYRYSQCNHMVCVDYNFVNWYRTQVKSVTNNLYIIPNFSRLGLRTLNKSNNDVISIIFARRFVYYRGTRLFANAIKPLLALYKNLHITFAGEGPDEIWLRDFFRENSNVDFISFHPQDSIEIHQKYDIAVVPTIGSEGTSLSLLEAMASHCAVIATDVGGLSNIIIDRYNGLLIEPKSSYLESSLKELIENEELRHTLANNGYDTVKDGFSYDLWKKRWIHVIEALDNN